MGSFGARARLILASIFLIVLLLATSYGQVVFHYSTYLALALMLIGALIAARVIFGYQE